MEEHVFIPFTGSHPTTTTINGHRLMLVCEAKESMEEMLSYLGADRVEEMHVPGVDDVEQAVIDLTRSSRVRVVVLPKDCPMKPFLERLEEDLPWIH